MSVLMRVKDCSNPEVRSMTMSDFEFNELNVLLGIEFSILNRDLLNGPTNGWVGLNDLSIIVNKISSLYERGGLSSYNVVGFSSYSLLSKLRVLCANAFTYGTGIQWEVV